MGNSVLQSGTSIGAILTPLLMTTMLTPQPGSWRLSFKIIGAFSLVWVLAWLLTVGEKDLETRPQAARSDSPLPSDGRGIKGEGKPFLGEGSFWSIVLTKRFLVLILMVACINTTWQLLRAWLPKILQQGRGYTESQALYFNSLYYVATDLGCLGAGALTLLLSRRGWSVYRSRSSVYLGAALLTCLTTVAAFLPKGWALLGVLLLIGMGALGVFPCYYAFSQELTVQHQGKVTGVTGVFAWIFSAPAHKFFGRLVDRTGSFDLGLAIIGWLPLLTFFLLHWFWNEPRPATQIETHSVTSEIASQ